MQWRGGNVEIQDLYDLLAAVYAQALKDADKQDTSAIVWLDNFLPGWREYERKKKERKEKSYYLTRSSSSVR